ncbi:hypothetical protein [Ruegeria jejuensis]|uniref:hypothetical protein n=1 Tax=Ruegeria jejuensis TaxID=3233338 RepID=UPI00355C75C6
MTKMTRAIYAGEPPFEGLVPAELDAVLCELAKGEAHTPEELRLGLFAGLHGFWELPEKERREVRMDASTLISEVTLSLPEPEQTPGWRYSFRLNVEMTDQAIHAVSEDADGLGLKERNITPSQAIYTLGPRDENDLVVMLCFDLNRPHSRILDMLMTDGLRPNLECSLKLLFADLRADELNSEDDIKRWVRILADYAKAVFQWWSDHPMPGDGVQSG